MLSVDEKLSVLEGAIECLRERGWTKEVLVRPSTGAVCVRGALWVGMGATIENHDGFHSMDRHNLPVAAAHEISDLSTEISQTLTRNSTYANEGLIWWNDERAQSADDVIHALELTAEALRATSA